MTAVSSLMSKPNGKPSVLFSGSTSYLNGVKGAIGRLKWWRVLIIVGAAAQFFVLMIGAWWGMQAHKLLSLSGINAHNVQTLLTSHDPIHEAVLFIREHPQLLGLARGAVQAAVNENGRVIVLPGTHRVIFDVSAKQTFRFLFDHILANHGAEMLSTQGGSELKATDRMYVVDLGAFDGLMASNSYNFLELGWRGLLVEPTPDTFRILKKIVNKFEDHVVLENVAVGDESKVVSLFTYDNPTSNSMYSRSPEYARSKSKVAIHMWRASALLSRHNVPRDFGLLSIDVEGMEQRVLHDILNAGYHPQYIVVEHVTLGLKQVNRVVVERWMNDRGYSLIAQIHLNLLFHSNSLTST